VILVYEWADFHEYSTGFFCRKGVIFLVDEINNPKRKSTIREYAEAILIALLLALFIRTFVVQAFKIPSGSMKNTLLVGDHILVNKFIYGVKNPFNGNTWVPVRQPKRTDIVVFKYPVNPSQDYIKRVIGIPGDRIEVKDKKVYVNNELQDEEFAIFLDNKIIPGNVQSRDNMGPIIVPKDSLFVMGDNRDNSYDSRFWQFVDRKAVKGKAFILYWSWDKKNMAVRWNRIGDLIH
jgi:signal peptidase I